ncbi:MAG: hypothetical protein KJ720_01600 [Proteobacteria bacterium]|nr:hypothetical protein [Pseudomonadota bacterium]MBU1452378.1 hypothetical protein [Pseudomonadota bacterium]MBU2467894.1 hypothetical protein [Pseudomonadota bacterium]MBU2517516.1 hypothetical protein [Pseudomonadota bacterium]
MRLPRLICCLLLAALAGLAACEGSFSCSTASLSDPKIATAVDPKTMAPTQVVSQVPPTSGPIYATAKVSSAPAGTKVKAVFYYLEGQRRQIAEDQVELKEGAYVSFKLSPPAKGWPLGKYEVEFFLDGEQAQKAEFSVAPDKAAAAPAPAAPAPAPPAPAAPAPAASPAPQGYKEINEPNFGFAFQVPSAWSWELTKNRDYLISGPKGTPAYEVALLVQIIDKDAGGTSLMGQMKDILAQISRVPQGKLLKKGEASMAGQQAPYFLASYLAKDSAGQQVEFGHAQVGVEKGRYLFLVSYSAPTEVYKANLGAFQRVVDSFRFTKP